MREQSDRGLYRGVAGLLRTLSVLLCLASPAAAQFYNSIGGVGRYFDPGRLRSVGGLRYIGGFQRVADNAALRGVPDTFRRPMSPFDIGAAPNQLDRRRAARAGESRYSAFDAGLPSLRTESSARLNGTWAAPDDSLRTYASLAEGFEDGREQAWRPRGLSIIGQSFAGQNAGFMPTSGLIKTNASRQSVIPRTDAWGRTDYLGRDPIALRSALGPSLAGRSYSNSQFRPLNDAVYHAAEVAVRADRERTDQDKQVLPAQNVSLDEVIKSRLQRRLDSYVQRGWTQFKNRQYAEAYNSFALAETIRPDAPEAKVGIILAAIATSQYIAASNAVLSMVEHNPDLLQQAVDMRSKYGSEGDFASHYQAFEDYMRAGANSNLGALYAFILWGRGDQTGARINAEKAAEGAPAMSPLVRLAGMMREAPAKTRG